MPEVTVIVEDKRWNKKIPKVKVLVRKVAALVLKQAKTKRAKTPGLAIVLANDKFMQELNHTYRAKNAPTNVLAFPADEEGELGDIILGLETIQQEAKAQGKTLEQHVNHMVAHGCLHLLGHDHMNAKDATTMEALEIKLLKQLNIPNPYAH